MLQRVEIVATHSETTPAEAFAVLEELERHIQLSDVVLSMEVEPQGDGRRISRWETRFRNGVLRWSELDEFDEQSHTMTFVLIEGDADTYEGSWRVEPAGAGCRMIFSCQFDIGIPTLAEFIDPLAVRLLRETIHAQLTSIFGPELHFEAPSETARE